MENQLITLGPLVLLGAMMPGPDVALVIKNTLLHSRRTGIFTSIGIAIANLIHIAYCSLGLAVVIAHSVVIFNMIKYAGAIYLIYLGITSLLAKVPETLFSTEKNIKKRGMSDFTAFQQGFLCNLLNPKASLFFLALFTLVIRPGNSIFWAVIYAVEIFLIVIFWFCTLTVILSHPRITRSLDKSEKYIAKALGIFLLGFGMALIFAKQS